MSLPLPLTAGFLLCQSIGDRSQQEAFQGCLQVGELLDRSVLTTNYEVLASLPGLFSVLTCYYLSLDRSLLKKSESSINGHKKGVTNNQHSP